MIAALGKLMRTGKIGVVEGLSGLWEVWDLEMVGVLGRRLRREGYG